MSQVTQILCAIEGGDSQAVQQLLPLVYDSLRHLAAARLAEERPGQTLEATALVHEAYVRLVDVKAPQSWESRAHFFAAAAEAMRRILIDRARHKRTVKRGGNRPRMPMEDAATIAAAEKDPLEDLLALDEALQLLEIEDPAKAQLVKLRYFAGLPWEEVATLLKISPATAKRHWVYARAWLFGKLQPN